MKKVILVATLALAVAACGKKDDGANANKPAQKAQPAAPQKVDPAEAAKKQAEAAQAAGQKAVDEAKKAADNAAAEAAKAGEAAKAAAAKAPAEVKKAIEDDKKANGNDKPVEKAAAAGTAAVNAAAAAKPGKIPTNPNIPGSSMVVTAPVKGPEVAKVSIIEISDFQCPFCGRVNPTIAKIRETWPNDVNISFKHNALSFHKRAVPAALASMAAHKQGKFWAMHDVLFQNQRALEDADLEKYAQQIGLNMEQFKADMKDAGLRKQIENDQKAAVALGQGGTPAFFINGKALSGAQPFEKFKEIIDAELAEADKLIAAGTPLKDVHKARAKANLGPKGDQYWNTLIEGKAAPRQRRPVDPTVWKADVLGTEPVKGKADALVTIVEFSDFQCPFCTRVNPTLKKVMEKFPNDVRIVWKNNALPFHKRAMPAAQAALAAHEQGKFWEMHDKLFANQKALEDADLEKYATELGLDMAKWKESFTSGKHKASVDADMELAQKINARGTPNFFVNGRNLRGAVPYEDFEALIEEELAKAKKIVEGGTAAAEVYAKVIANGKVFEPLEAQVNEFTVEGRPFMGAENGDIIVYEFSDFQCPYCQRLTPQIKALTTDPELKDRVKVVWKNFPLSFHKQAKPAAIAALAAHQQGKFWEFHDKNFANMKALTDENFKTWAKELGLDMAKFEAALKDPAVAKMVDDDMAEGRKAGLRGTPTIYINGRKFQSISGYSPAAFKTVINKYFPKK